MITMEVEDMEVRAWVYGVSTKLVHVKMLPNFN